MSYPGQTKEITFEVHHPTTRELADTVSTPVGVVSCNGVDDTDVTVTVTQVASPGRYKAVFSIPASYSAADDIALYVSGRVSGMTSDDGATVWRETLDGSLTYESAVDAYCTDQDLYDFYGEDNINKWAHISNYDDAGLAANEKARRRAKAIEWAYYYINDRLRGSQVTVPVADSTAQPTMRNLNAQLAGYWLATPRGIEGRNPEEDQGHPLLYERQEADRILDEIRTGKRRLQATGSYRQRATPFTS